jgi:hypothetical protein
MFVNGYLYVIRILSWPRIQEQKGLGKFWNTIRKKMCNKNHQVPDDISFPILPENLFRKQSSTLVPESLFSSPDKL